jgi:hypothetical protein
MLKNSLNWSDWGLFADKFWVGLFYFIAEFMSLFRFWCVNSISIICEVFLLDVSNDSFFCIYFCYVTCWGEFVHTLLYFDFLKPSFCCDETFEACVWVWVTDIWILDWTFSYVFFILNWFTYTTFSSSFLYRFFKKLGFFTAS